MIYDQCRYSTIQVKINLPYDSIFYRAISVTGQFFIKSIEAVLTFFSKEKGAVIEPYDMPWVRHIEANTANIVTELNGVMRQYDAIPNLGDLSAEQKRIIKGEMNWKTFMLYTYGAPIEKNLSLCPVTNRIIQTIPGMTTAFFSILEPHTSLTPHRGPYKGVLRYHLGLIVPEPNDSCGIRIDGSVYHWQVGKSLIFDDTYNHEAWNNSPENRVVLFIDFKRDFPFPISMLNDFMIYLIRISPFVSNILKKIEQG